jgi:hypothetical protein
MHPSEANIPGIRSPGANPDYAFGGSLSGEDSIRNLSNLLEEFFESTQVLSYTATVKAAALITKSLAEEIHPAPSITKTGAESHRPNSRLVEQAVEKAGQLLVKSALRDIDEWKCAFLSGSQDTTLCRAKSICRTFDDKYGMASQKLTLA